MDVFLRLFCACAALSAQVAALRRADARPRSPTDFVKDQEPEKRSKSNRSAVVPWIYR
jgi:hypothetical protein